jgi:hypothetical protein
MAGGAGGVGRVGGLGVGRRAGAGAIVARGWLCAVGGMAGGVDGGVDGGMDG